jgi:hypothetical protein
MSTAVRVVRARKNHRCPNYCDNGKPGTIQPGQLYLRHVAFPGDSDIGNEGFWVLPECRPCAEERGRGHLFQPAAEAGA